VADYIWENVPPQAVIYHHWMGHYFLFYLFGAPQTLRWYETPDILAADVCQQAEGCQIASVPPRYLVAPSWEDVDALRTTLEKRGLSLTLVHQVHSRDGKAVFGVYFIGAGRSR
jgi:hypothetical protein